MFQFLGLAIGYGSAFHHTSALGQGLTHAGLYQSRLPIRAKRCGASQLVVMGKSFLALGYLLMENRTTLFVVAQGLMNKSISMRMTILARHAVRVMQRIQILEREAQLVSAEQVFRGLPATRSRVPRVH